MKPVVTPRQTNPTARYAVLEMYRDYARRTHVVIADDGSLLWDTIAFTRTGSQGPAGIASQLVHLLQAPLQKEMLVVLIFDTESAVLVQNAATVARADWNAEISASEFEAAIKRSIAQLHQRERSTAAKLLGAHELQVQLADVDLVQVRVDGHQVMSPIGFRSHDITVTIRQAFVRIDAWQHIASRIPVEQIAAVTTRGGFWAGCVSTMVREPSLILDIDEKQTVVYETKEGSVVLRDSVLWGSEHVFKAIVAPFGLPLAFAPTLLELCAQERCSKQVAAPILAAVRAEFSLLSHTIEAHQARRALPVFIQSAFDLPALSFLEKNSSNQKIRTPFSLLSLGDVVKGVVHYSKNTQPDHLPSAQTPLAVVARMSVGAQSALLQKSPNQRMRWIL